MNSLIIDCSDGMSLILLSNEKEFSYIDDTEKKHSDELLVVLDNLLEKANLKIQDIENICVCIGPGSFTGVRVAISICKGLAIGVGAKVFVLSNLDIFDCKNDNNAALVLDGFSDFVYVRVFENQNYKDACMTQTELKNLALKQNKSVYVVNEKMQKKLNSIEINANFAKNNIKNAFLNKIIAGDFVDINTISPVYLRASQAEIERNKKLAGGKQ